MADAWSMIRRFCTNLEKAPARVVVVGAKCLYDGLPAPSQGPRGGRPNGNWKRDRLVDFICKHIQNASPSLREEMRQVMNTTHIIHQRL